jgi:hypothetical protein
LIETVPFDGAVRRGDPFGGSSAHFLDMMYQVSHPGFEVHTPPSGMPGIMIRKPIGQLTNDVARIMENNGRRRG